MTHPIAAHTAALLLALSMTNAGAQGENLTTAAPSHEARFAARLREAPEPQLKALYLQCQRDAMQGLLDFGDAARCSIVHEVLLKHVFRGDFQALVAWWRQQRRDEIEGMALR